MSQHTEMSKLTSLRRQQAETLESELNDKQQYQSQAPHTQPATPERPTDRPATPSSNPYQRAPPVSPHHDVTIPSKDSWNKMVRTCKEKVTLTYSLPHDVKELNQIQAKAFYCQIESNFKGYPAIKLHKFESLRRQGSSIPVGCAMGWMGTRVRRQGLHHSV